MIEQRKLKSVEQYGSQYVEEYLASAMKRREAIMADPLEALAFMYGKMFMRGRRDAVSVVFRDRTIALLRTYKRLNDIDLSSLDARLQERKVNNRYDRRMVIDSISFVSKELHAYDYNVFNWAVGEVLAKRPAEAYKALTGIFAIGDKLATFYLRDVALLEGVEGSIPSEDYVYFQPVDTWVKQVARSLQIIDDNHFDQIWTVKSKIIDACIAAEASPLLFNAGAWMVGAHAYRLLLDRL